MELGLGLAFDCIKAFVKENSGFYKKDGFSYVSSFKTFEQNRSQTSFFSIDKRVRRTFQSVKEKVLERVLGDSKKGQMGINKVVNFLNKPVRCSLLKGAGHVLDTSPKLTKLLKIVAIASVILGAGVSVISPPGGILMATAGLGCYGCLKIAENTRLPNNTWISF
ncbi:MAG: hypothetical protein V4494_02290 [Chlamydiota bacterium]